MFGTVGIVLIFFAAFLFSHQFSAYRRRRLAEAEAYLRFLAFLRRQVGCYSRPLCDCCTEFRDEVLEEVGFLPALRETGELNTALGRVEGSSLSPQDRELLFAFAREFGGADRAGEVGRLDSYSEELTRHTDFERRQLPKTVKLVRTMCFSASLAAVILLI